MQFRTLVVISTLACAASFASAQGGTKPPTIQPPGDGTSSQTAQGQPMQNLQQAAQKLRESIHELAQKKSGPDRDGAIAQAQQALLETHRAMIALPPEKRSGESATSNSDFDKSIKQLMGAADNLRHSIDAIARQPAGERRNQALSQARKALWDTQQAMMSAYDPVGSGSTGGGTGSQSKK